LCFFTTLKAETNITALENKNNTASQPDTILGEAEKLFSASKYEESLALYRQIQRDALVSEQSSNLALCRIGMILSTKNDLQESKTSLEKSLRSKKLSLNQAGSCFYTLIQVYYLSQEYSSIKQALSNKPVFNLNPTYSARMYALSFEAAGALNDPAFKEMMRQNLLEIMKKNNLQKIEIKIAKNKTLTLNEVEQITVQPLPNSSVTNSNTTNSAKKLSLQDFFLNIQQTNVEKIEQSLIDVTGDISGKNIFNEQMKTKFIERAVTLSKDSPSELRIGIIFPKGSAFTKFKYRLAATTSAFLRSKAIAGVKVSVHIVETTHNYFSMEKATLDLILDSKVHAIIGPLATNTLSVVAPLAQLFAVPVFPLGPVAETKDWLKPNVFRIGVLARSQTNVLTSFLKEQLNYNSASVLAPNDPYGYEMAKEFYFNSKTKGINIKSVLYYAPSQQVFDTSVKESLGSQSAIKNTPEYKEKYDEEKASAEKEKRKIDSSKIKLPAFIPFDALFLPDTLEKAKVIASTFAFHEAKGLRFLGDKSWLEANSTASLADPFLLGAKTLRQTPGGYFNYLKLELNLNEQSYDLERQLFDAFLILRKAQFLSKSNNGNKIQNAIISKEFSLDGVSQYGNFFNNREPDTKFELLHFKNGKFSNTPVFWPKKLEDGTFEVLKIEGRHKRIKNNKEVKFSKSKSKAL
jgi:Receptor family ligand binding region